MVENDLGPPNVVGINLGELNDGWARPGKTPQWLESTYDPPTPTPTSQFGSDSPQTGRNTPSPGHRDTPRVAISGRGPSWLSPITGRGPSRLSPRSRCPRLGRARPVPQPPPTPGMGSSSPQRGKVPHRHSCPGHASAPGWCWQRRGAGGHQDGGLHPGLPPPLPPPPLQGCNGNPHRPNLHCREHRSVLHRLLGSHRLHQYSSRDHQHCPSDHKHRNSDYQYHPSDH